VFGVFEAGMPVLGVALGQGVAASLGQAARWLGGAALIVIGLTSLILAQRGARGSRDGRGARVAGGAHVAGDRAGDDGPGPDGDGSSWRLGRIVVSGLALSVDNLAAGFALGAYHTGLALAATVFGAVSVIMTLAGLELGARLGASAGDRSELIASVMLIAVGIAVAVGVF
jgi:manganese efflux pump family protein